MEPLTVAGIARAMDITRQSVQRLADLVEQGLAEYQPNPAHRRAKLLLATDEGRAAVHAIGPAHGELAQELVRRLGPQQLAQAASACVDTVAAPLGATPELDRLLPRRHDQALTTPAQHAVVAA